MSVEGDSAADDGSVGGHLHAPADGPPSRPYSPAASSDISRPDTAVTAFSDELVGRAVAAALDDEEDLFELDSERDDEDREDVSSLDTESAGGADGERTEAEQATWTLSDFTGGHHLWRMNALHAIPGTAISVAVKRAERKRRMLAGARWDARNAALAKRVGAVHGQALADDVRFHMILADTEDVLERRRALAEGIIVQRHYRPSSRGSVASSGRPSSRFGVPDYGDSGKTAEMDEAASRRRRRRQAAAAAAAEAAAKQAALPEAMRKKLFAQLRKGRTHSVYSLVRRYPAALDALDSAHNSLLTLAAAKGDAALVRFLLHMGANPNHRNNTGDSPVVAVFTRSGLLGPAGKRVLPITRLLRVRRIVEVLTVLLPDARTKVGGVDEVSKDASLPPSLGISALSRMDAGSSSSSGGGGGGESSGGSSSSSRRSSGRLSAKEQVLRGASAEEEVAHMKDKLLLPSALDLSQPNSEQRTALHYAAELGDARCVQLLLSAGIDDSITDLRGMTALALAVARGATECVGLLRNWAAIDRASQLHDFRRAWTDYLASSLRPTHVSADEVLWQVRSMQRLQDMRAAGQLQSDAAIQAAVAADEAMRRTASRPATARRTLPLSSPASRRSSHLSLHSSFPAAEGEADMLILSRRSSLASSGAAELPFLHPDVLAGTADVRHVDSDVSAMEAAALPMADQSAALLTASRPVSAVAADAQLLTPLSSRLNPVFQPLLRAHAESEHPRDRSAEAALAERLKQAAAHSPGSLLSSARSRHSASLSRSSSGRRTKTAAMSSPLLLPPGGVPPSLPPLVLSSAEGDGDEEQDEEEDEEESSVVEAADGECEEKAGESSGGSAGGSASGSASGSATGSASGSRRHSSKRSSFAAVIEEREGYDDDIDDIDDDDDDDEDGSAGSATYLIHAGSFDSDLGRKGSTDGGLSAMSDGVAALSRRGSMRHGHRPATAGSRLSISVADDGHGMASRPPSTGSGMVRPAVFLSPPPSRKGRRKSPVGLPVLKRSPPPSAGGTLSSSAARSRLRLQLDKLAGGSSKGAKDEKKRRRKASKSKTAGLRARRRRAAMGIVSDATHRGFTRRPATSSTLMKPRALSRPHRMGAALGLAPITSTAARPDSSHGLPGDLLPPDPLALRA